MGKSENESGVDLGAVPSAGPSAIYAVPADGAVQSTNPAALEYNPYASPKTVTIVPSNSGAQGAAVSTKPTIHDLSLLQSTQDADLGLEKPDPPALGKPVEILERIKAGKCIDGDSRGCTDIIFLILFILFWGAWVFVIVVAVQNGSPKRIIRGTSWDGRVCDGSGGFSQSYQWWANPFVYNYMGSICVAQCPSPPVAVDYYESLYCTCNMIGLANTSIRNAFIRSSYPLCTLCGGEAADCNDPSKLVQLRLPTSYILIPPTTLASPSANPLTTLQIATEYYRNCAPAHQTFYVINRCFPNVGIDALATGLGTTYTAIKDNIPAFFNNAFTDFIGDFSQVMLSMWGDVINNWDILVVCICSSIGLCFLYFILVRFFCKPIVFLTLIGLFAGLCLATYMSYINYNKLSTSQATYVFGTSVSADHMKNILLATTIIAGVVSFIYLCLLIFLWSRISIACSIIEIAASAMGDQPFSIFYPFILAILVVAFVVGWCIITAYLITSGTFYVNQNTGLTVMNWDNGLIRAMVFHVFGGLWMTAFLSAFGCITLSGAFGVWYYTTHPKSDNLPSCNITRAFGRAFRYHIGTAAFGSLILAIIRFIQLIVVYIEKKTQGTMGTCNPFRFCLCCIQCCLACVERCVKWISQLGYVFVAINGCNFCSACKNVFQLLLSSPMIVGTTTLISKWVIFFGKLCIATGCATGAGAWLNYRAGNGGDVITILFPCLVVFIGAYVIAMVFMVTYDLAIDTIMVCFCYDEAHLQGHLYDGVNPEDYMPSKLHDHVKGAIERYKERKEGKGRCCSC